MWLKQEQVSTRRTPQVGLAKYRVQDKSKALKNSGPGRKDSDSQRNSVETENARSIGKGTWHWQHKSLCDRQEEKARLGAKRHFCSDREAGEPTG
jgi:hypothetical protein